jgi:hypothetical protein
MSGTWTNPDLTRLVSINGDGKVEIDQSKYTDLLKEVVKGVPIKLKITTPDGAKREKTFPIHD